MSAQTWPWAESHQYSGWPWPLEVSTSSSLAKWGDYHVIAKVKSYAHGYQRVMICLDSNHTHEHVLEELRAYAPLTTPGCYCVVFDTFVEDMPKEMFPDRPWGPGNNPKTAVWEYLKTHPEFEIDADIHNKLLISVAPDGYLKRVK